MNRILLFLALAVCFSACCKDKHLSEHPDMPSWMPFTVGQQMFFADGNGNLDTLTCTHYFKDEVQDPTPDDCWSGKVDRFVEHLEADLELQSNNAVRVLFRDGIYGTLRVTITNSNAEGQRNDGGIDMNGTWYYGADTTGAIGPISVGAQNYAEGVFLRCQDDCPGVLKAIYIARHEGVVGYQDSTGTVWARQ